MTCLSYWFPRLVSAGLPVPRTEIVATDVELMYLLDGKTPSGFDAFLSQMELAAGRIGFPCFLRTGHGSGKHDWERTCYLTQQSDLTNHIVALTEWSAIVDFMGLPTNVWVIRELLPTVPQFVAFRGMPICREFRFFVRDSDVLCWHPYWPKDALEKGFSIKEGGDLLEDQVVRDIPDRWQERYEALCYMPANDKDSLHRLASAAGSAMAGDAWSVDILETKRGWFITDMAEAASSFHWEGCEKKKAGATS